MSFQFELQGWNELTNFTFCSVSVIRIVFSHSRSRVLIVSFVVTRGIQLVVMLRSSVFSHLRIDTCPVLEFIVAKLRFWQGLPLCQRFLRLHLCRWHSVPDRFLCCGFWEPSPHQHRMLIAFIQRKTMTCVWLSTQAPAGMSKCMT